LETELTNVKYELQDATARQNIRSINYCKWNSLLQVKQLIASETAYCKWNSLLQVKHS
jgi:hypothetical protein